MIRPTHALVALAVAAVPLAACGGESAGEDATDATSAATDETAEAAGTELDTVRVGVIPIVDVAPLYLGEEQGFFAEEGLALEMESGQGGAAIVPGVVAGQLEVGFSNVTSLLLASAEGLPVQMVGAGASSTGEVGADFGAVVVPADSEVTDAAGLAGQQVAVNTLGNIGDTTIRQTIRNAGGDPEAVEFVELPFPDMPAALAEGRVDAAWVVEPFLSITQEQGATPVAWNFVETDPELTVATYFTSAELAESDPELVERFAAALTRSLDYAQENPEEARAILADYTVIEAETAEALTLPRWPSEINEESVLLLSELAAGDGLLDGDPDLDTLLP